MSNSESRGHLNPYFLSVALIASLVAETGLDIKKVQIGKIDLMTQSVKVTLFY
jgi:hypothetical protein